MGARLLRSQSMTSQLGLIVILLFLDTGIFVHGDTELTYYDYEIEALEKMRTAWQGTPDFSSNLVGWSSNISSVCEYIREEANATRSPSWQGVECSAFCLNATIDPNCTIWSAHIIGFVIKQIFVQCIDCRRFAAGSWKHLIPLLLHIDRKSESHWSFPWRTPKYMDK